MPLHFHDARSDLSVSTLAEPLTSYRIVTLPQASRGFRQAANWQASCACITYLQTRRSAVAEKKRRAIGSESGFRFKSGLVSVVARGPSARRPGSKNLRNKNMTARVCRDHQRFRRNAQAVAEQVRVPSHIHGPNRSKNLY